MPKCTHCKRKNPIMLPCKWCVHDFCTRCLSCEIHVCPNIDDMRKFNLKTLEQQLLRDQVQSVRIIKL
jgi:hypothetical protein